MPEDFFKRVPTWSKYKLDILGKYLHTWASHLQVRSNVLSYVDLCAGAGEYQDGTPGSPLIAARTNENCLQKLDTHCRLQVLACERSEEAFGRLKKVMEPYVASEPTLAKLYNKPFQAVLPRILHDISDTPAFVFLDPFGVKSIAAKKLRPLLADSRREPMELLVRVDPRLLARYSGWLQQKDRAARWEKTAKSFERLLKELEISDDLMEQIRRGEAGKGRRMSQLFEDYIELFEARFRYVHYIPIRRAYNLNPKYYLVFGTDSPHGVARLNDVASTTEDDVFRDTMEAKNGQQLTMFEPVRKPRVEISDAQNFVLSHLGSRDDPIRFIELQAELALRFGPDLRDKDHRRAVQGLVDDGRVAISPLDRTISSRTTLTLSSQTSPTPH